MNQKGQAQVLILAGIVLALALVGGAYYLGRVSAPRSTSLQLPSTLQPVKQMECKSCSDPWDTSCPGNTTCFVPAGATSGVCVPILKMGATYTIDYINNMCGTNFSDETANWKTYTNSTYHFAFKYPNDWVENNRPTALVSFGPPKEGHVGGGSNGISMGILPNPNHLYLNDFIKQDKYLSTYPQNWQKNAISIISEVLINRAVPGAGPGEKALISKGEIIIDMYCGNCENQIFDQILATLRFIN